MDRYGDGDSRSFSELHASLSPRLRGFLMKLVRDEATVDDLLQLTFLEAHLARERYTSMSNIREGAARVRAHRGYRDTVSAVASVHTGASCSSGPGSDQGGSGAMTQ